MIIFVFDRVKNIVGKGENAGYQHFLLFPQCFEKASFPDTSKGVIVREWVNYSIMSVFPEYVQHYLTYPHLWIQLVSSQLFGLLFVASQPDQIFSWKSEDRDPPYLMADSLQKVFSLLTFYQTTKF